MVEDGFNPSERHPTGNRHGQWEHNAAFSYEQPAALPLLQTQPSKHTNFGAGPPTGSREMAGIQSNTRYYRQPTPLVTGPGFFPAQHQHAFHSTTLHTQYGHQGPVITGERPPYPTENALLQLRQLQQSSATPSTPHDNHVLARLQHARHGYEAWYGVEPAFAEAPYFGRGEQPQADLHQSPLRHGQQMQQPPALFVTKGNTEGSFLAQL